MKAFKRKTQRLTWIKLFLITAVCLGILVSCSPYAGVSVGVPFKVGPVYVNPSIGVGGFL